MDRQTQAVAEELVRRGLVSHSLAEEVAKVAIAASDAKYVPELVAALRRVAATYEASLIEYEGHGAANFDPVLQDVRLVIKGLPEEHRK